MRTLPTVLVCLNAWFWGSSVHAEIRGRVLFRGKSPAPKSIDFSADPACWRLQNHQPKKLVAVNEDRVVDAFVYLEDPPEPPHRVWEAAELNVEGCAFSPRVFGMLVGQKLRVTNQDPTLHTVHVRAAEGGFLKSLPRKGQAVEKRMRSPQVMVPIESRSHPWMRAYMAVLEHPYFGVTGRDGTFAFDTTGLPDGTYRVRIWHPELGEATGTVRVIDGRGQLVLTLERME